jgi:hypothetical protein
MKIRLHYSCVAATKWATPTTFISLNSTQWAMLNSALQNKLRLLLSKHRSFKSDISLMSHFIDWSDFSLSLDLDGSTPSTISSELLSEMGMILILSLLTKVSVSSLTIFNWSVFSDSPDLEITLICPFRCE